MSLTINSSMFTYLKNVINKYFRDEYRWRYNDEEGAMRYYKGKRNLKEIAFIVSTVFGDLADVVQKGYYHNLDGECVGGYIIIHLFVDADFNGMNQGTKGDYLYCKFNLFEETYSVDQSIDLDYLVKDDWMKSC
ncbi:MULTISPECIES: hypothetical protein [Bacillus]|uniref:Uncharacterized protein n=3 Tax=Bacillus thuringiensis TaxID=1428 RepID=A0AAP4V2L0_BACTU|nr:MULTISPECIES: hypothetical protein [Bacillus]MEC0046195.1 hypothetical protein [Bacillus cereus]AFV21555.1 hypothetical protein BTB_502p02500 [Bacillus thuringiensis Bt407]ERI01269.1 hypothetical protein BTCBT_002824 [Bacillus thuringiensis T01-328]MDN7078837.1 hypothetical protein [Bacillus thuringiensis]MDQ7258976.1 hypothetical protein [Bacillus thuringiensis]